MNNDNKYKIQTSPLSQGENNFKSVTQQTNSPKPITNHHSLIYSNQSQSIQSLSESNVLIAKAPNFTAQSKKTQENLNEKMLICKSQLVSFAQCFAQEKIQLENSVSQLKNKLSILTQQLTQIHQQNTKLKYVLNSQPHFKSQSPQFSQQIQTLKSKLKQQFEKRIAAQKQFHNHKALSFQLNKKIEFLTQKLTYQQQQLSRCQNLLKIKQDIIQNFEWEKTIIASKNNSTLMIQRHLQYQQQQQASIKSTKQQLNNNNEENLSPLTKKNFSKSNKKFVQKTTKKSQINQTMNLSSEINFNTQNKKNQYGQNIQLTSFESGKKITSSSTNKVVNKYAIGGKMAQDTYNDSKKKLNISLKKRKSQNNSLNHTYIPKTKQTSFEQQKQIPKPKSILLKRHAHAVNQSMTMAMTLDESLFETRQKEIEAYYMRIISELEKQNSILKSNLIQVNQNISQFNNESSLSVLKSSVNKTVSNNNKEKLQIIQRKYNMMKQKCLLLENQIQKTVDNYLQLQQKNTELQKLVQSLQSQLKNCQYEKFQELEFNEEEEPLSRPSLELSDLVTPQFKDTKWKSNFFAKTKDQNHAQKLFQNISLQENNSQKENGFLATFEKQKPLIESCLMEKKISNSLFIEIQKEASNIFKNEIQDVSEIICRNDGQEVLEETF